MRQRRWWWVVLMVLAAVFISSSMTYRQQSLVPLLTRWFNGRTPRWLAGVDFWWASDQRISTRLDGPAVVVEFFLRKLAHFGCYAVIGGAGWLALRRRLTPGWLAAPLTWLATVGLAALDEFHQSFTPGRSPLFQDVMLDATGAAVGLLVAWLIAAVRGRKGQA